MTAPSHTTARGVLHVVCCMWYCSCGALPCSRDFALVMSVMLVMLVMMVMVMTFKVVEVLVDYVFKYCHSTLLDGGSYGVAS